VVEFDTRPQIEESGLGPAPVFRMHELDPTLTRQLGRAEAQCLFPRRIQTKHVTVQVGNAKQVQRQRKKLIQFEDGTVVHLFGLDAFQGEGEIGGELIEQSHVLIVKEARLAGINRDCAGGAAAHEDRKCTRRSVAPALRALAPGPHAVVR
jgi:hypothetical protein